MLQLMVIVLLLSVGWLYSLTHADRQKPRISYHPAVIHALPVEPPYEFPEGGRQLFPKYRLVALYGTPNAPVLGSLGRQDLEASIKRVKQLAEDYQKYSKQPILPTFEIISTVASASPTDNNDYSRPVSYDKIKEWVIAAQENGIYVILDLQSGRSHSLEQAKQFESILLEPNVGLALDPEWRLQKLSHRHMVNIGSISAREVNAVADWLAKLTRENNLPQKIFLLHQFRMDMLPDRDKLKTNHPELAYTIQMDGQGSQSQKDATWGIMTRTPPGGYRFGWKNFYEMDTTLLSPQATMAKKPKPWYVSYQ